MTWANHDHVVDQLQAAGLLLKDGIAVDTDSPVRPASPSKRPALTSWPLESSRRSWPWCLPQKSARASLTAVRSVTSSATNQALPSSADRRASASALTSSRPTFQPR